MSNIIDSGQEELTASIAGSVRAERRRLSLSVAELAKRSGVSRAMIGKVERGEAQPTAVLLARLASALGLGLSELIASAERGDRRLASRRSQPVWTDPETGYRRRLVTPAVGAPLELVEIELPGGAAIAYPAGSYPYRHQQIWVLAGTLEVTEDDRTHTLRRGDCLVLGAPGDRRYHAPGAAGCRYLVAGTPER